MVTNRLVVLAFVGSTACKDATQPHEISDGVAKSRIEAPDAPERAAMDQALQGITRLLALALADSPVRSRIYEALRSSK
jgi:hypothetical protein